MIYKETYIRENTSKIKEKYVTTNYYFDIGRRYVFSVGDFTVGTTEKTYWQQHMITYHKETYYNHSFEQTSISKIPIRHLERLIEWTLENYKRK
jgi:hypothetical protein